jgi:hypothetical protein
MRTRALRIVGIVWAAAMVAVTVAFIANRPDQTGFVRQCPPLHPGWECPLVGKVLGRTFSWGGWAAWAGALTLMAIVAAAIVVTLLDHESRQAIEARS